MLEPEQETLLAEIVEAHRGVPREKRQYFEYAQLADGHHSAAVFHEGYPGGKGRASQADLAVLDRSGLIFLEQRDQFAGRFTVLPAAIEYYERLKSAAVSGSHRIMESRMSLLESEAFRDTFDSAYHKWLQAESALWKADVSDDLTTIGHLCRESLQEFADVLGRRAGLAPSGQRTRTVDRLRKVIAARSESGSVTMRKVLDALVPFWGSVTDLVQRQEHGAEREKEPLVWADARRVVLLTAIVMAECAELLDGH